MKNKKFLALLLCVCMLVTMMPPVFATETNPTEEATAETTAATEPTQTEATEAVETTEATTETTSETTPETTVETTQATEETTESTQETTEATEETTEPTEEESFTTFTTLDGNSVQVGDKIWIKNKQTVYASMTDTEGYQTLLPHEITIKAIAEEEGVIWFRFENFTLNLMGYKYVKASSTSTTEPGENDCDCGSNSENLADHADDCARKKYVLSLIQKDGQFKTAEEIFEDWDSFDEQTKTDIWALLDKLNPELSEELAQIIEDDANGFLFEKFEGSAGSVGVSIMAGIHAFPSGTVMTVTPVTVEEDTISGLVSGEILDMVAVDISFGGQQPEGSVSVYIDVPDDRVPASANAYAVIHMGANGPELVTSDYLNTTGKGQTVSFTADSFSSYVVVLVNKEYKAKLLGDVLEQQGNTRYTIKTLKANLFDYDAEKLNPVLIQAGGGKGFVFPEISDIYASYRVGINLGGSSAKMGILNNLLNNGLPVFNYLGDSGGVETGKILFDPTYTVDGKDIYANVDFEFIYDNQTGYYTYNGALNHAQLNKTTHRVELYADTLSMANEQYVAPKLNAYVNNNYYLNSITNISASENSFTGTISGSDPYITYSLSDLDASNISSITVRAKITPSTANQRANEFAIYFSTNSNGYCEGQTIRVSYTPNGEWMEFVFDPSTAKKPNTWTGKINGIRLDPINGEVNGTYTFEIDWIQINQKDSTSDHRYGGYYPFSDISDSVPGRGDQFNLTTWSNKVGDDDTTQVFASRAIFNSTKATAKQEHLAFGTVIEQQFYIPVSGKTDNGGDIKFTFTGDDDLWVFVDGKLVLDIGGGHTPVTGSVNFTAKQSWVQNATQITGYDTPKVESTGSVTWNAENSLFPTEVCEPGLHTMTIIYMERHSGVSNCYMKFNLPMIPEGSVVVSKKVQDESGADIEALKEQEYSFTITAEARGNSQDNLTDPSYTLVDTNGTYQENQTATDGKFKLKANQTALFDIPENYKVTVTEDNPSTEEINGYQYVSTQLSGSDSLTMTVEKTVTGQTYTANYVNRYKLLYGEIQIKKTGISDLDSGTGEDQTSLFRIYQVVGDKKVPYMDVTIVGNDTKVIKQVPIGNYIVEEITDWTWRYDEQSSQEADVTGTTPVKVAFENKRKEDKWLSGDSYVRNWWGKFSGAATS